MNNVTRFDIDQLLNRRDELGIKAIERAIVILFSLQSADERNSKTTQHLNSQGFNSFDAFTGTRLAQWLLGMDGYGKRRYPPKTLNMVKANQVLTKGESALERARQIALKHSQQLVMVANNDLHISNPE